ncbi:MAG: hypothetical protein WDM81_19475 [Rhizomicrobium sp.]
MPVAAHDPLALATVIRDPAAAFITAEGGPDAEKDAGNPEHTEARIELCRRKRDETEQGEANGAEQRRAFPIADIELLPHA